MTTEVPKSIRTMDDLAAVEGGWIYRYDNLWWAWPTGGIYSWGPYQTEAAAVRQLRTRRP